MALGTKQHAHDSRWHTFPFGDVGKMYPMGICGEQRQGFARCRSVRVDQMNAATGSCDSVAGKGRSLTQEQFGSCKTATKLGARLRTNISGPRQRHAYPLCRSRKSCSDGVAGSGSILRTPTHPPTYLPTDPPTHTHTHPSTHTHAHSTQRYRKYVGAVCFGTTYLAPYVMCEL